MDADGAEPAICIQRIPATLTGRPTVLLGAYRGKPRVDITRARCERCEPSVNESWLMCQIMMHSRFVYIFAPLHVVPRARALAWQQRGLAERSASKAAAGRPPTHTAAARYRHLAGKRVRFTTH